MVYTSVDKLANYSYVFTNSEKKVNIKQVQKIENIYIWKIMIEIFGKRTFRAVTGGDMTFL